MGDNRLIKPNWMEEALSIPSSLICNWDFWFQKTEKVDELVSKISWTGKVRNYRKTKLSPPVAPKAHKLDGIYILHKRRITEKGSEHNRISNSVLKTVRKKKKAFKQCKKGFIGKQAVFIADNRD